VPKSMSLKMGGIIMAKTSTEIYRISVPK